MENRFVFLGLLLLSVCALWHEDVVSAKTPVYTYRSKMMSIISGIEGNKVTLQWNEVYLSPSETKKGIRTKIIRETLDKKTWKVKKNSKKIFRVNTAQKKYIDKTAKPDTCYRYRMVIDRRITHKYNGKVSYISRYISKGSDDVYTGIVSPKVDSYYEPYVTKDFHVSLSVDFYSWGSYRDHYVEGNDADGFVLYRSTDQKKYKKIAAVSGKKKEFLDETVTPMKTYYYKLRAYYKNGSKKVYSEYSDCAKVLVRNPVPKLTETVLEESENADTVSLKIDSNANNGTLFIDCQTFPRLVFPYVSKRQEEKTAKKYQLTAYSMDEGKTWMGTDTLPKELSVSPGKSICLRGKLTGEEWVYGTGDVRFMMPLAYCYDRSRKSFEACDIKSWFAFSIHHQGVEGFSVTNIGRFYR